MDKKLKASVAVGGMNNSRSGSVGCCDGVSRVTGCGCCGKFCGCDECSGDAGDCSCGRSGN